MGRTVLITGASGFLGSEFCRRWAQDGWKIRALARETSPEPPQGIESIRVRNAFDATELAGAMTGATTVLHLGAMVHVARASGMDRLEEFRRANVEWTRALLQASGSAGVSEFVFLSSVKVVGESNTSPWNESTPPRPQDAYGLSKLEAEQVVLDHGRKGPLKTAVLRIPLAYGPGTKANMLQLFRAVRSGLPLPLGAIHNQRSLVYSGNLVAAVEALLACPGCWGETYFVSDGSDLSTPDLIRTIARALGRPARLVPVPSIILRAMGRAADLAGGLIPPVLSSGAVSRLVDSLTVDISKITQATGYRARFTTDQGFHVTAQWYQSRSPH
jgi:nucleoside-diphosphate-sugar epimerase